jgi:hypothetical protein
MSFKEYKSSQLGAPVRAFLQSFKKVHSSGGSEVGLDPFIEPVRDNFGDKNAARVEDRGSVYLSETSEFGGSFECSGRSFFFPLKGFRINFPATLKGSYIFDGESLRLSFNQGATIYASKFIFKVRLQKINLSNRRVDLDLEGDSYDISYILV